MYTYDDHFQFFIQKLTMKTTGAFGRSVHILMVFKFLVGKLSLYIFENIVVFICI